MRVVLTLFFILIFISCGQNNDTMMVDVYESDSFNEVPDNDDCCDNEDSGKLDVEFYEEDGEIDIDNGIDSDSEINTDKDNEIDSDNEISTDNEIDTDKDDTCDNDIFIDENDEEVYVFPCPEGTGGKNCDLCVRYVSPDNTLNKSGLSWNTAFNSIQNAVNSAIDAISSGKEKCSIFIEEGIYGISSSIFLSDKISITGGFYDGNVDPDFCDPQNHATILDGLGSTPHILIPASDMIVENLTIKNGNALSSADENGGGILIFSTENLLIKNCEFISNTGKNGGAVAITDFSDVEILDCKFLNNTATNLGGAIYLNDTGNVLADRNRFSGNCASSGGAVSFVDVNSEKVYLYNSLFTANNCDLAGSVLHLTDSFPMLAFNTIAKNGTNSSETLKSNGSSDPILAGNIIFFNNGESISGKVTAYYNNIELHSGTFTGSGNINTNPEFVNFSDGDFHLLSSSECIDAVDLELDFIKNDLEGILRPQNSSFDMGCFESM